MSLQSGRNVSWWLALMVMAFSLLTPAFGETGRSFVLVKEISPWIPGRAETSKQLLLFADGKGQSAELLGGKVVSVAELAFTLASPEAFAAEDLFKLEDVYATPSTPGLIVEGHGGRMLFVIHANGRTKFISAETARLPQELKDFRQKFPINTTGGRTGSFLSAGLLSAAASADLRTIPTLPEASPKVLADHPELGDALASPFKLVPMSAERWQSLLGSLKLSAAAAFVKVATGDIMRLEFNP